MGKTLILSMVLVSFGVYASEPADDSWAEEMYKQRVEPQVRGEVIKERHEWECSVELDRYLEKLEENPDSEYFKYKVEELIFECEEGLPPEYYEEEEEDE